MSEADPTRRVDPDDYLTVRGLAAGQTLFGRYTLLAEAGRGGMGVVWRAHDQKLERDVALKLLPEAVRADPEAIRDLKRETVQSLALTHPHIVRVHDFVEDGSAAAIAMEFVDGSSLAARKAAQPHGCFEPAELAAWLAQLCAALDYAHGRGRVVHRDLKPANLLIDRDGQLKVTDFGIARSLTETRTRLTGRAGGTSGTLLFMSPQQLLGKKSTAADDLYALGATLYDLLTGKPPFYSGNVSLQLREVRPDSLAERRAEFGITGAPIPPEWEQTIAALLAKDPARRPQSAGVVAQRLGLSAGAVFAPVAAVDLNRPEERRLGASAPTNSPGRADRPDEPGGQSKTENQKSQTGLYAAFAAGFIILAAAGWYFGSYAPEQKRLAEVAKLEAAGRGGLVIRTNPAGAEVRVGAIALDKSPLTLKDQKLGKYPVRVRLDGYEEWTGEVEVKENDFADLDVTLVRSMGTLVITSTPAGASILHDGKEIGRTPFNTRAQLGGYRLTLQLKGYKAAEVSGEVARNAELRLSAQLEKIRGPEPGQLWTVPDLNLQLQPIAPGTFEMGSATGGESGERPVTRVTLTRPFWLGKTEVTQAQWQAVMGSNPANFKGDDRPVEQVSWDDAMEFCRKLTERERAADRLPEGYSYTLPTEAQWEYACRAGTTGDYAGDLDTMGWYGSNSGSTTHPVGQKQANAWGLYDMHGNVWEWCLDWKGDYPGGSVTDPTGAASGSYRVIRGGGWFNDAGNCRSADRYWYVLGFRYNNLGFRFALSSVP